jgi:hypothetical protein
MIYEDLKKLDVLLKDDDIKKGDDKVAINYREKHMIRILNKND